MNDNNDGIIDSDPTESPFLQYDENGDLVYDENGNPVHLDDEDLVVAELGINEYSGGADGAMNGFQVPSSTGSRLKIWSSADKQYDRTNAVFTYNDVGVPRWQAPDGRRIALPSEVYVEGTDPGISDDRDGPRQQRGCSRKTSTTMKRI